MFAERFIKVALFWSIFINCSYVDFVQRPGVFLSLGL